MKLKQLFIPIFAMMLLFVSCHDTAKQSCRKFLNAYLVGDFTKAQQYATPETQKLLILLNDMVDENRSNNVDLQIKLLRNEYSNDSTVVLFCQFYIDDKLDSTRVLMAKTSGRWLAKFPYTDRYKNSK